MNVIDKIKSIENMGYDRAKRLCDSIDRNPGAVIYAEAFPEHARGMAVYKIQILPPLDPSVSFSSRSDTLLSAPPVLTLAFTRDPRVANAYFLDGRVFSKVEADTWLYADLDASANAGVEILKHARDVVMVEYLEIFQRDGFRSRKGLVPPPSTSEKIQYGGEIFTLAEARAAWSRVLAAKKAARVEADAEEARRTPYWDPE